MKAVALVVSLVLLGGLAYIVLDGMANANVNAVLQTCGAPNCQPLATHILSE